VSAPPGGTLTGWTLTARDQDKAACPGRESCKSGAQLRRTDCAAALPGSRFVIGVQ